ncbi:MAG: hypothetical protein ACUZ77_04160 [Candidatus Brocadiales bacterium]
MDNAVQVFTVVSGLTAAVALIMNFFVFRSVQKNVEVQLLADCVDRVSVLLEKQKDYEKEKKQGNFCVLFLGQLEWLAYLVNKGHLPFAEVAILYRGLVVTWYEGFVIKERSVLSDYLEVQPEDFTELKILYQKLKSN